jgi:hypothetical protein
MTAGRQFSVAYILIEVGLCATALAAIRFAIGHTPMALELQALCFCAAATAVSGAAGGLCLRMGLGLVAGAVLSVAAIPSLIMLLQ